MSHLKNAVSTSKTNNNLNSSSSDSLDKSQGQAEKEEGSINVKHNDDEWIEIMNEYFSNYFDFSLMCLEFFMNNIYPYGALFSSKQEKFDILARPRVAQQSVKLSNSNNDTSINSNSNSSNKKCKENIVQVTFTMNDVLNFQCIDFDWKWSNQTY